MSNKNKFNGYYALRWEILVRDSFTCQYCGQQAPNVMLEIDHIKPKAMGGNDSKENLTTSCRACNRGKGALSIQVRYKKQGNNNLPYVPSVFSDPSHLAQDEIIETLKEQPLTTKEVAQKLNRRVASVRVNLNRYRAKGLIKGIANQWYILP